MEVVRWVNLWQSLWTGTRRQRSTDGEDVGPPCGDNTQRSRSGGGDDDGLLPLQPPPLRIHRHCQKAMTGPVVRRRWCTC